ARAGNAGRPPSPTGRLALLRCNELRRDLFRDQAMKITRRFFLQSTGALAVYLGVAPLAAFAESGRPAASPAPVARGKTLVVIFLRGGIDGLNLIVPHGDEHYYRHRRGLAIQRPVADG